MSTKFKMIVSASYSRTRHTEARPKAKLTPEEIQLNAEAKEKREADIDNALSIWYTDAMALTDHLAAKWKMKPKYFHELMFQGGTRMVNHQNKLNAYNMFKSVKAAECRGDPKNVAEIHAEYWDDDVKLCRDTPCGKKKQPTKKKGAPRITSKGAISSDDEREDTTNTTVVAGASAASAAGTAAASAAGAAATSTAASAAGAAATSATGAAASSAAATAGATPDGTIAVSGASTTADVAVMATTTGAGAATVTTEGPARCHTDGNDNEGEDGSGLAHRALQRLARHPVITSEDELEELERQEMEDDPDADLSDGDAAAL
ncbi:hypothetical protein B0H17DRAFT_1207524 [Mycena rosella]|uniref:Uncharacterized protein n=1 Tax=Mycena rosella TaxID=1033263 RepID=A0AAD7D2N6_MYCRO|nr:hypothetical protein B0H17DRAFT_1207524 [Mycena rosella]